MRLAWSSWPRLLRTTPWPYQTPTCITTTTTAHLGSESRTGTSARAPTTTVAASAVSGWAVLGNSAGRTPLELAAQLLLTQAGRPLAGAHTGLPLLPSRVVGDDRHRFRFLTIDDVADEFSTSPAQIRALIKRRELPALQSRRRRAVPHRTGKA